MSNNTNILPSAPGPGTPKITVEHYNAGAIAPAVVESFETESEARERLGSVIRMVTPRA